MPLLSPRLLVGLLIVPLLFSSCETPEKKAEKKKAKQEKEDAIYKIRDDNKDVSFRSFVGQLRKAVANRDVKVLSTLMTADFAYSWAPGGQGYGCFQYWDENNLWPELQAVVADDFVSSGNFLVAPKEFAEMGEEYGGFRAGVRREKGSFKLAYFVPPEDAEMPPPPSAGN